MRIAGYPAACRLTAALFLLALVQGSAAAEYTVAPSGGQFTSIRAAVAHAGAGDTILVKSGYYQEKLLLDKRIALLGIDTGAGAPLIDPAKKGNAVEITADGCTFSGFLVQNAGLSSGIRISSDRNTITRNTVKDCAQGIFLASAGYNTVAGNNITHNARTGITLEGSGNNRIENNLITGNTVGIALDEYSVLNRVFLNNFDNTMNVASKSQVSVWDSGKPLSFRYLGRDQTGRMGNYWSDYHGKDASGDGIGDTPYVISLGANKRAVLPANQNAADSYPLMDPREFYAAVSETPPEAAVSSPAITPSPSLSAQTAGRETGVSFALPRLFLLKTAVFSTTTAAMLVSVVVFCIAVGALVLMRRRDLAGLRDRLSVHEVQPAPVVAAGYGILGAVLGVLSTGFMVVLASIPPSNPLITGAWLLCALCIYLSASSFTLAYGVLKKETYPAIATLHGIFSAIAVPVFALFMVFVPERREAALFAFIFVLAVSAALPFWQQGKFRNTSPALPSVQQAATPAAPAVTLPVDAATATTAGTQVPDRTDVHQPPFDQKSFFPRELENRYYDITYIGRGGIAWVYCAKRKSDGMKVAVKIPISFDEMTGKSFLNEIKAWEMLRHPNIVEISAVNILPVPFVEMEYVPGSLEATAKPVPVWKAVHIVRSIADALHYAHGLGLIHRDIKPHNILVTDDLSPKISDWGMSKLLAADPKKSSIAGFSLSYAAPEQVSPAEFGRTDARTDIYQLGVLFYELVTGSIPFCGESIVEVGNAILRVPPVPPSKHIPEAAAVDRIILRCLEKDPQKRYQSAAELLDALAGYLDEDEP